MKNKDVIKLLQAQDPEAEVIMQRDAEGNGFSPFYGLWIGGYKAEKPWFGEVKPLYLTKEQIKAGYSEEDDMFKLGNGVVKAIILKPVN